RRAGRRPSPYVLGRGRCATAPPRGWLRLARAAVAFSRRASYLLRVAQEGRLFGVELGPLLREAAELLEDRHRSAPPKRAARSKPDRPRDAAPSSWTPPSPSAGRPSDRARS